VKYRWLLELQDTIGAQQFFEGWITVNGKSYKRSIILTSNPDCLSYLIMNVAWGLWDFQNAVYHQQKNKSLQEDTKVLDLKVSELFNNLAFTGLLPKDHHLATFSIKHLLLFPHSQK
jgi:hypothetical protein